MVYVKNNWVDREGTTRYFETVDDDGALILTPDYTQVTEMGTPVNADNMNHIEEGIAAGSFTKYDSMATYAKNDLVTTIVDNELKVYKSLQDNNTNTLDNSSFWEEVEFSGAGGLEIGDIGIAPLGIDETKGKRRYLNGQLIIQDQYVQFTNKIKSAVALYTSLACTEEEWQATALLTVGGQVGKFVVDDEAGTIRLPRIIMPIQGLTDLSKLAEIVEAGLPNITGRFSAVSDNSTRTGAFTDGGSTGANFNAGPNPYSIDRYYDFNASRSNPIYGISDTVQQEQVQYPYFIQVATGAETEDNIINEIELNNPFFLGMSQYFESEPNNISWLKSAGQYNSKATYPAYYDWLLKIYNGTEVVEGVSVKLSTEEYTDYDFVLNTAEETFRLPLLDGSEGLISDRYDDLEFLADGSTYTAPANGWFVFGKRATVAGQFFNVTYTEPLVVPFWSDDSSGGNGNVSGQNVYVRKGQEIRINYNVGGDVTACGFIYATGNGSLYFYVGETVQNANLINAGRIEEKLVNKADTNASNFTTEGKSLISGLAMPSSKTIDFAWGASGAEYTAPANGYFNAGGYLNSDGHMAVWNKTSNIADKRVSTVNGFRTNAYIPAKKGDVVQLQYGNYTGSGHVTFIYAEGEV